MRERHHEPHRRGGLFLIVATAVVGFVGVRRATVACCTGLVRLGQEPRNGIRVERLEADLHARLPDGSTWVQAEVWFAAHGVRPGGVRSGDGCDRPGAVSDTLYAIIPNDSLLETATIRVYLTFTPAGRLRERDFHRVVFGP